MRQCSTPQKKVATPNDDDLKLLIRGLFDLLH